MNFFIGESEKAYGITIHMLLNGEYVGFHQLRLVRLRRPSRPLVGTCILQPLSCRTPPQAPTAIPPGEGILWSSIAKCPILLYMFVQTETWDLCDREVCSIKLPGLLPLCIIMLRERDVVALWWSKLSPSQTVWAPSGLSARSHEDPWACAYFP